MFIALVIVTPLGSQGVAVHMVLKETFIAIYTFGFLCCFVILPREKSIRYSLAPLAVLLLLLFVWAAMSIAWAANRDYAFVHLLRWATGLTVAGLALQLRSMAEVHTVLKYAFAACVMISTLACIQFLTGFEGFAQSDPPAATFANRNMATHIVVLTWLIGPYFLLTQARQSSPGQYFYAIGTALALTFLIYAQTRSAWLAMAGQLVLVVILLLSAKLLSNKFLQPGERRRLASPRTGPLMLSTAVFLVLIHFDKSGFHPVYLDTGARMSQVATLVTRTEGAQIYDRFLIWQTTLHIFSDHAVIGAGLGSFEALYPHYAAGRVIEIRRAHNDYLQTLAELGMVGTGLLLAVLALLAWHGLRSLLARPSPTQQVSQLLLVLIGGIAIVAVFSFPGQLIGPTVLLACYLGIIVNLGESQNRAPSWTLSRRSRLILGAMLVASTGSVTYINYDWMVRLELLNRQIASNGWHSPVNLHSLVQHPIYKFLVIRIARAYIEQQHPEKAESVIASYRALNPDDVVINNLLARAHINQGEFEDASSLIAHTRPLEPTGYYRSYELEMLMVSQAEETERLVPLVDKLMTEPRTMLMLEPALPRNIAIALFKLERKQEAAALLEENLSVHPFDLASTQTMVDLQLELGNVQRAETYLARAIELGADARFIARARSRLD